jgi:hypothetical protein
VTAPEPSREEARAVLGDLLAGRLTREQAADWASPWVREQRPAVEDSKTWETLKRLAGADLRVSPVEYLHNESDFHAWLDEIEAGQ